MNDSNSSLAGPYNIAPFGVVVFFGGLLSALTNLVILVAVIVRKELKSKCYQLMGNLALADLISSLGFFEYGLFIALGFTAQEGGTPLSNQLCFYLNVPFVLSFPVGSFMILVPIARNSRFNSRFRFRTHIS